jgi:hypothetical protein
VSRVLEAPDAIDLGGRSTATARRRKSQPIWLVLATEIIPVAPPCFESRDTWVSYVIDSAAGIDGDPRSILRTPDGPTMNPAWDFCVDCLPATRAAKSSKGKCNPHHLREVTP